MKNRKSGFTLVELMIVLAIIAIVSTLAIVNMRGANKSANEVAAIKALDSVKQAQAAHSREMSTYALLADLKKGGDGDHRATSARPTEGGGLWLAYDHSSFRSWEQFGDDTLAPEYAPGLVLRGKLQAARVEPVSKDVVEEGQIASPLQSRQRRQTPHDVVGRNPWRGLQLLVLDTDRTQSVRTHVCEDPDRVAHNRFQSLCPCRVPRPDRMEIVRDSSH